MSEKNADAIYILDSGVFLSGAQALFAGKACITVPRVVDEMKSERSLIEMDRFLVGGLQIIDPSSEGLAEARSMQKKTHDKASETDLSIVALAHDLKRKGKKAIVVSDDYAIQNLCRMMNIRYSGLSEKGIKKSILWTGKCKACGFAANGEFCPNCGNKIKFVAKAGRK